MVLPVLLPAVCFDNEVHVAGLLVLPSRLMLTGLWLTTVCVVSAGLTTVVLLFLPPSCCCFCRADHRCVVVSAGLTTVVLLFCRADHRCAVVSAGLTTGVLLFVQG